MNNNRRQEIRQFANRLTSLIQSKDLREIISGTSVSFFIRLVGLSGSYIFNIIFARLYGAEVLGIFSLTMTVVGIFSLFACFGANTSVVRFVSQFATMGNYTEIKNIYKKYLLFLIPLAICLGLLLFISSPFLAVIVFKNKLLTTPFKVISFTLPFSVLLIINNSALRGLKKIGKSYIFQALMPITNISFLLLITYIFSKNYLTPIYAQLSTMFVVAIVSYTLWQHELTKKTVLKKSGSQTTITIRDILENSFPMLITAGMLYILGWTDTIMLGIFADEKTVGIYTIALKISLFTSFTLSAVNSIAAPKFAELYWANKKSRLKKTIQQSAQIAFFSSLPIFLTIIFFSNEILNCFGSDFIDGGTALIILSFSQFCNAAFGSVGTLLDMTGNQKAFRNAVIIGAILNIILNAILIPIFGIIGAAIATSISTIVWNLLAAVSVSKIFGYWAGFTPIAYQKL